MERKKNPTEQGYREYATVSDAALILGISIDTVRRWESAGKLHAKRLDGKNRYFEVEELHRYKSMQPLSTSEVAALLNVSQSTVRRLENQQLLMPLRSNHGKRLYDRETVDLFIRERDVKPPAIESPTLIRPQRPKVAFARVQTPVSPIPRSFDDLNKSADLFKPSKVRSLHHSWVRLVQKAIVYAVSVGILLISMFVFLLIVSPVSMSRMFWMTDPSNTNGEQSRSAVSRIFQPFADRALRVVDVISPETRGKVQPVAPASIPQLFTKDENGNIITNAGFSPPNSSYLRIPDSNLVVNLNSEFVQGEKPGDAEGDLALLPITSSHIKDGTITSDDIASGTITLNNLSDEILVYLGSGQQTVVQQPIQQASGIDGITAGAGLVGGGSTGTPTISLQTGLSTEIIAGSVEAKLGTSATATTTSISGLEISSSGLRLLGGCGINQLLKWNGTAWTCGSDIAGGGSFDVQEGGSTVTSPVAAINFNANDFSVTDNVGQANVVIDYASSSIARRNQNETITSTWSFANASFSAITAGAWQGSVVSAQYGGTGLNGAGAANGQVLIGNGTGYSLATLGAGTGISVINGAGTISIASALGTSISNTEIDANAVSLGAQTTGNFVGTLGALTGLSTTGNSGEGSTPTLSVTYGSAANTAVQGNTSLTCATGTGNLTGGGNAITLGTGGTCSAISTNAAVSFSTSITTPSITNAGALGLSATGVGNNLTLNAGGSIILGGFNCTSFTNGGVLTTNASGVITCDNDDGGAGGSISGAGTTDRVPIYTAANTIGSSWLVQSGTTLQLDSGRDLTLLGGNVTATTIIGALTGNASTASALAANPSDCSASQFATTIAANGNLTCATLTDGDIPNTITIDLASTATALAANPSDCSANQFATTIAANGTLSCAALTDGDIPNSVTVDLATAATSLAVNPIDCSANQFATTIAANGNLTCASITDADVSDTLTASLFVGSGSTTTAIDLGTAEVAGTLTVNRGGTGITSYTIGDLIYASGATTLSRLADVAAGSCLVSGGVGVAPTWGSCAAGGGITGSGTLNNLPIFTSSGTLGDSTLSQNGTTLQLASGNDFSLVSGTVTATTFIGALTGNASTASALAANPSDCSANQFATTIAANGNLTCAAITDADIPDSITITLAATAAALAANPTDCSANQFANAIAANGNLTCAAITDADVSDTLTASLFVGSGSTTTAIDLGTAEVAGILADANVSDTLTSSLFVGSGSTTTAIDLATAEVAGNLRASNLQSAAADLGAADVNINLGNTNGAFNTNLTLDGSVTAGSFIGAITGNASTATALAANPTDCSANQFAIAIVASGNLTCAALADADIPDSITITLAATATALAANPSDCSANQFATTIAANGNLTCAALTDGDIPNSITVDLATAASSLAVNPSDCSANQFATTIAANGNLTCAAITDADVSDTLTASLFVGSGSTTTAIDLATAEVAGNLRASNLQSAAADLGAADVTINLGNTNGSFNTNLILDGTITAASFVGEITGNASTATALAANPSDCSANQFATTIAANGNLTCAALTDGDIPNSITIDLATAASSLASDPSDCSAGEYATTIAANGNLTCATVSEGQVSGVITDVTAGGGLTGGASSGNATLNIGAGNGITVNADDISVIYGSAANTAVQGNATIVCPSGSGNLSGGGTTITLGSGGTCGGLTTNNAVSFSASVTTPLVTNAGVITLSTTGANDLTLTSGSDTLNLNAATVRTTTGQLFDLNNTGSTTFSISNSGTGVANLNVVEGSIQTAGSTRITNAGVLQNVSADTGILTSGTLSVARGGTGVNGASAANGSLLIGNGSGYTLSTLSEGSGISVANAAGSITISSTLGASISNSEIDSNAVTLSAQTTGNYVATLGAVTGLTTTGNSGEGSSPTLSVDYGSSANTAVQGNTTLTVSAGAGLSGGSTITLGSGGTATLAVQYGSTANTAVQGNTTLTCASGTGNLTGGGSTITLGTGGSCGAISTNAAVSFATSVTTPIVQNAGILTLGTTATAGADDILFRAAGNEVVRVLENGDIRFEKGADDVTFTIATPGAPATYTFSGASGTVLTGTNYSGTLDATYVNIGEAPAAGDIAGTFSGGLNINSNAVTTAKIADLNVTNGKLLNSSLTVSAGAGLSGGGSVALGASTSLAVAYGATANTAVQGNTTLTCPSGTGNLTGGGASITLGTGGSCGAISTNAAVSFATSVTSPLFTNAGALTLSTTGLNDLTLTSGSSVINLNAATLRSTASLAVEMNNGSNTVLSVTNTGAGAASLSVEGGVTVGNLLTVTTGGFNVTGNSTITGTLSGLTGLTIASGGANITGVITGSSAVVVGNTFTNTTGAIRWTGADFQGYDGATWQSFTAVGGGTSTSGRVQQTFNTYGAINMATSTTVALNHLLPTSTTAFSIATVPSTPDIRMSSAGSIRGCSILSSAAVTGGSVSVRFRKNGAQASATNYCTLDNTVTRSNTQEVSSGTITFVAGDTIGVQLVSASMTPAGSLDFWASYTIEYGTATTVNGFANGGNAFSANALLGTTDNFSLSLMTNNTTVLTLATSGLATFSGAVTTNGVLTASNAASISGGLNVNSSGITNAGNITGVGANITATGALTVASGGAGALTLDSASNTLSIAASDTTLQRSAAGIFTLDLSNASVTTFAINNSTVGSTNLNLVDGELQTAGTSRLTNTGVLQNITGLTISSGGATANGTVTLNDNVVMGSSSTDRLTITSQILGATPLVFQGATDNSFSTSLQFVDPTANNTITIPNASGTLVLDSRAINTAVNSGLSGGGNLSADRTLSLDINNLSAINTTSNSDYLAVYDSNTLGVKKVSRSDFLQGVIGALIYQGTWNAATNTPVLSDGTGSNGEVYVVSVGATRDLGSGNIVFSSGDFVIHNGTRWEVAPSSSDVASVFGRTGAVSAVSGDYSALQITSTPAGNLSSTNVQAALNELDTEKIGSLNGLTATSQTFTDDANITISSAGSVHTLGWAGQLSVARGGTGVASFTANGVIYGNNAGVLQVTAAGTSGQLLVANASGVPTFVSASGDITLSATGLTTINVDSVTLATDTVGSYVANLGALTGLTTTGNSGEGSTPTLSVTYGTSANTAVQGSTSLTCASGTGNLSGGGTVITLGSGGTCGSISIVNNPTFSSSVITPTVNSASTLTLVSGGSSDILLDSASGILRLADDETTIQRIAAGTLSIDLSDTANTVLEVTNSGAGTASLSVEDGGTFGSTITVSTALAVTGLDVSDADITNAISIGDNTIAGNNAIIDFANFDVASSGAVTLTGNLALSGDASEGISGGGLTDCDGTYSKLQWDATTNKFSCGTNLAQMIAGSDATNTAWADNNTTELWNGTKLSITVEAGSEIFVVVSVRATGSPGALQDTNPAARVDREGAGVASDCADVNTVGGTFGTNIAEQSTDAGMVATLSNSFIDAPGAAGTYTYAICTSADSQLNGTTTETRIDLTLYEINDAGDLAEIYSTNDATIKAGEVVSIDPSLRLGVKRASKAYDSSAIGIVATKPALLIGSREGEGVDGKPVALSGRVPVKVSAHNGAIKKGDLLTSSSIPGVAMKATKSGAVLGVAMSDFSGAGVGEVLVFVQQGQSSGSIQNGENDQPLDSNQLLAQFMDGRIDLMQSLDLSSIATDRIAAALEIVTPKIVAEEAELASIIAGANGITFMGPNGEAIGSLSSTGNLSINEISTKTLHVSLDLFADGRLTVSGPAHFKGTALFDQLVTFKASALFDGNVNVKGIATFNNNAGGYASIKTGQQVIHISFSQPYDQPPIIGVGLGGGKFASYGYDNVTVDGFDIILNTPATEDLHFSWTAKSIANPITFSQQ